MACKLQKWASVSLEQHNSMSIGNKPVASLGVGLGTIFADSLAWAASIEANWTRFDEIATLARCRTALCASGAMD